jgi:hypothetical protein
MVFLRLAPQAVVEVEVVLLVILLSLLVKLFL